MGSRSTVASGIRGRRGRRRSRPGAGLPLARSLSLRRMVPRALPAAPDRDGRWRRRPAHQARTSSSPAATLSHEQPRPRRPRRPRCPLASTSRPNSPGPARRTHRHTAAARRRGPAPAATRPGVGVPTRRGPPARRSRARGIPATRASATVAASCRLPKWSTQVTSVRRQDATVAQATLLDDARRRGARATSGSTGLAERPRARCPRTEAAAAGAEQVAPVEGRRPARAACGCRRSSTTCATGASPTASAAATSSPLSGPTKDRAPPAGSATSQADATARSVPTPGSTTAEHHSAAEVRHRPFQCVAARRARRRAGVSGSGRSRSCPAPGRR